MKFLINILLTIVYPNRILSLFKVKNLDENSSKIFGNDKVVKILALIGAVAFVISVGYTPRTTTMHQELLQDVPVRRDLDEAYANIGNPIPTHVDVVLIGDRTEIEILMATSAVIAYIDLDALEPGKLHNSVLIEVEGVPEHITATIDPSIVRGVEIAEMETIQLPVTELAHDFPEISSRYQVAMSVYPEYVIVRGPQKFLDEIAAVRAPFDPSNITDEPNPTYQYQAIVVAHDITAQPVRGIEFYPQVVEVRIAITENLRTINIKVNEERPSNMPRAYEIINITPNIDEIEVWGDFSGMDSTIELPRIDFRDLDEEGRITIPIETFLPDGVYSEITEVELTVVYEEIPLLEELNGADASVSWIHSKDEKRRII